MSKLKLESGLPSPKHELKIEVTPEDLPDDDFSGHVSNARDFAFINQKTNK